MQLIFLAVEIGEESLDAHPCPAPALACGTAIPYEFLFLLRQLGVRHIQAHTLLAGNFFEFGVKVPVARFGPGIDSAVIERERGVGDDQVGVEINGVAEAVAARAGSVGAVEGEQARLRLGVGDAAALALELLVEGEPLWPRALLRARIRCGVGELHHGLAAFAVTDLQAVNQPLPRFRRDGEPVGQDPYGFAEVEFEQRLRRRELDGLAVLVETVETQLAQLKQTRLQPLRLHSFLLARERLQPCRTAFDRNLGFRP